MIKHIDCLLVAYSGISQSETIKKIKGNEILEACSVSISTMSKPFNMAVGILGTYLHKNGFTFDYISSVEDEKELLAEKLRTQNILSVGISTSLCENIYQVNEMIDFIRGFCPSVKIILGGTFIIEYVRSCLQMGKNVLALGLKKVKADFIIDEFYGEATLSKLVSCLKDNLPFDELPNIYYMSKSEFIFTKRADEDTVLKQSTVDWSLFTDGIGKTVVTRTSLSCKFACSFCNFPVNAGRYQNLTLEEIEKELDSIGQLNRVEYVNFIDDTFNVPVNRFKDILRMMIKNKYGFKWYSFIRCQYLDEETVDLMKKSGCIGVILGIESGNDEVLTIMNKQTSVEAYKRGIDLLNRQSIPIYASFIIGFPGESESSVKETIAFIEECKLKYYVMRPWFYDTRTPIQNQSKKFGLTGSLEQWSHNTMDSDTANRLIAEAKESLKDSVFAFNDYVVIFQAIDMGFSTKQINEYLEIIN